MEKNIQTNEYIEHIIIDENCLESFNHLLKSLDVNKYILQNILNLSSNIIIKNVKNTHNSPEVTKSELKIKDSKKTLNIILFDGDYNIDIQQMCKNKIEIEIYISLEKYINKLFKKNKITDIYVILLNNIYYYFSRNGITDVGTVRRHLNIKYNTKQLIAV